ncbi:hypothetical protein CcaverHIS641_0302020 [Cutaneotrichosporon cavernicola]|nr:hypothetical protein CcaverHIS641_0302020 [Cutaneotrichosporon cavernicola]
MSTTFAEAFEAELRISFANWPTHRLAEIHKTPFDNLDQFSQGLVLTAFHNAMVQVGMSPPLDRRCACEYCGITARMRRWSEVVEAELTREGFL